MAGKEYQIPAVGFAYGLERISEFFGLINGSKKFQTSVNHWTSENGVDIVLFSSPKTTPQIFDLFYLSEKLRADNKRVSIYVGDGEKEQAQKYSMNLGAEFVSR